MSIGYSDVGTFTNSFDIYTMNKESNPDVFLDPDP